MARAKVSERQGSPAEVVHHEDRAGFRFAHRGLEAGHPADTAVVPSLSSEHARTALRLRSTDSTPLLQPEIEASLCGRADPVHRIGARGSRISRSGSGCATRSELAPYIGLVLSVCAWFCTGIAPAAAL
jgi:hypothetical protein